MLRLTPNCMKHDIMQRMSYVVFFLNQYLQKKKPKKLGKSEI
jgi:hypothetical protein